MAKESAAEAKSILPSLTEMQGAIQGDYVKSIMKSELREELEQYIDDKSIFNNDWEHLTEYQREIISDACEEILKNSAPIVIEYELEQDFGPYPGFIRGVKGCYFLDVMERDAIGPYADIEQAKLAFDFLFGEFLSDAEE